ncbi:hypothetical protein M408DRAFT_327686 [Serendipita vermifera MAFF 305830]|uniref:Arrestin C-terminal-like domain-containing protein n=1 Tax=Serendipita vermifera MAFF 305830 TaxID=933852 RepID=A0A0C2WZL4_SERVB|nr:hypothetical protein M408DRAFT_327686 [Serendipita vermifera MAFF 305830]
MNKNSATLRLTEPVIFLRAGTDSSSRRRRAQTVEAPPALLRAILTLKLVKPTRVNSIDVTFEGTTKTDWPDVGGGIATRRMEVHEENTFISSKIILFQADQQKRSRTVGPGLYMADHRAEASNGIGNLTAIDNAARGRRLRRESVDPQTLHRQPFAAVNGPAETVQSGPSNVERPPLQPRLELNTNAIQTSSDPALYVPGSLAPSPAATPDTPPVYSSLVTPSRPDTADSGTDAKRTRRRSSRLSLSGMLHDVRGMVQGHPSRHNIENEGVSLPPPLERRESDESDERDERGRSRGRKDKGTIARIGEVFGLDLDEDDKIVDDDSCWKELKPGVYNYPISFTLPSDLPSTIDADWGSVQYKLKANVHRPGAFTQKISTSTAVELVSAPAEEDTEEGDSVVIERQWDMELRYLISISGRNFPQGADIPWHVQLLPLSKFKLHRLSFILEEKIDYVVHSHHLTRSENVRRFQLVSIRHPQSLSTRKDVARAAPALLPILSRESSHSSEAVLLPYADPPTTDSIEQTAEERKTEALAHLLNPTGPWHLHGMLRLPLTYLHTTHKQHKLSFVSIKHALKIILRVERGDDDSIDPKTGKRKQFDIIIETPINILSKYCRPDWASLPPYESLDVPPTTDPCEGDDEAHMVTPSRESSNGHLPASTVVAPATSSRPHTPHGDSPRGSVPSSPIEPIGDPLRDSRMQASQRFANLMAGFEDEGGELPPTYQSVTGTPADTQPSTHSPLVPPESRRRQNASGSRGPPVSRGPSVSRQIGSRNSSRAPDRRASTLLFHPE